MNPRARAMADIANTLLATLSSEQRSVAQYSFPSEQERTSWFYTPTDHGGLTLHTMSPEQTRLVMRLIDSALSRPAYVTASTIMGLENVLDQLEGWGAQWNFPRGRDPQRYFLRIFGEPGSEVWGWRIGGHHLSLNFTIQNDELVSATPCFLGADPAASPLLGGQLLRPLGACEDLARELLSSLNDEQRHIAIVSSVPPVDLVGANRPQVSEGDVPLPLSLIWRNQFTGELQEVVERIQTTEEQKIGLLPEHIEAVTYSTRPKGLAASEMNSAQRDVLKTLLSTYVGRIHDDFEDDAQQNVASNFESIHFAWAGGMNRGLPHYYRLQGPRLLAEYDNTTRDGNHVHTVWRNPINDFGVDALSTHHQNSH